jgi:hypothetical protein
MVVKASTLSAAGFAATTAASSVADIYNTRERITDSKQLAVQSRELIENRVHIAAIDSFAMVLSFWIRGR